MQNSKILLNAQGYGQANFKYPLESAIVTCLSTAYINWGDSSNKQAEFPLIPNQYLYLRKEELADQEISVLTFSDGPANGYVNIAYSVCYPLKVKDVDKQ